MGAGGHLDGALAVDCACELGEGILWDDRRAAWLWTDIESARLWLHRPSDGTTCHWELPDRMGCFALFESGRVLLGLAKGLAIADIDAVEPGTRVTTSPVVPIELELPDTRINDGRTDRDGRFVFGTFNERAPHGPLGGFYQYCATRGLRRLDLGPVGIANSLSVSLDGRSLYFCDSATYRILRCDYDSAEARVWNVREFIRCDPAGGMPDGSVIDADGCLWNAQWGGGCVQRYTPDGHRDVHVSLPVPNITCLAFGGAARGDIMITSARMGMDAEALAAHPEAGGLFGVRNTHWRGVADRRMRDADVS